MVFAGLQPEHVAGQEEFGDLAAAVRQDAAGPDHATEHAIGAGGRLAFAVDLFVAGVAHPHARDAQGIGDLAGVTARGGGARPCQIGTHRQTGREIG